MIKVSIIIPIYNGEKWINQCLTSVISQTLKEIEVICVDNGSKDNSWKIIQNFLTTGYNIKAYSIANVGAGGARNYALTRAKGEFVTFLDVDDYYPSHIALEVMYNAAKVNHVMICGGLRLTDLEGKITPQPLHRNLIKNNPKGKKVKFSDFQFDYHFHSYIYNREMLKNNNILFPLYKRYEDPVFFVNAMIAAKDFFVVPIDVYCYRKKRNKVILTPEATLDTIYGITENLRTSSEFELAKLHYTCVQRLNKEYAADIIRAAQSPLGGGNFISIERGK